METETFSHETTIAADSTANVDASQSEASGQSSSLEDDEEQTEAISGAPSGGEEPPEDSSLAEYEEWFDLSIGTTVVEDKSTNQEIVMWKAKGDGKEAVSPEIFDAVMQCIEKITGGSL